MLISVTRAGSKMLWHTLSGKPNEQSAPLGKRAAVVVLLALSLAMTIFANPIRSYTTDVAEQLYDIQQYPSRVLTEGEK
jgi:multicomponent K+:H+ antiporter subunit D